ncbi:sensor histidine kinase [Effusibacillus pohliae]|uniref:sensor histidine kinase n=1 Tax=Effusibacillus pohliae TaxID=232270 RepID=UPI0003615416|nr:sensor histidine kinase [Effusibacillus pohliae]
MRTVLQKLNAMFRKNTGLSPYVWIVFYILPFYFIFRTSSLYQVAIGIAMVILFFVCYLLSFFSKGWLVYFWTGVQIVISTAMGFLYGYIYFSLFLAFFIGNLRNRAAFFTLYAVHLISTLAAVNYGFAKQDPEFIKQLPFVLLSLIAVILLPVSSYNKNREDRLIGQLENANKRIAELVKLEERQRIARDLHDTLGQKLSLIGLKSDLALKLIRKNPKQAEAEMRNVLETARAALKEARQLVTRMRGAKLEDEIERARQLLTAAQIEFEVEGDPSLTNTSLINENVACMCLKEAVTNIVKHSGATRCTVSIDSTPIELVVRVRDNGLGFVPWTANLRGSGLRGMKERLEFVNGNLDIRSEENGEGTTVIITVPNMPKRPMEQGAGV